MSKSTYWIADVEGVKAVVEGAEARDWWVKVQGWSLAGEPTFEDRVWLQHNEHGGRQVFPAPSVAGWAARGWQPSDPPVPQDKATAHWALEPAVAPEPSAPASTKSAANATSGDKKEQVNG
jgi:hypothetical protein